MSKTLRIILLVILVALCGLFCIWWITNPAYKEAREYLNRTIPSIVEHWDLNDLRKYSGSCLLKQLDGNDKKAYESLFKRCEKNLGSLKTLGNSQIRDRGVLDTTAGCTYMYGCSTQATFDKGTATIVTSIYLSDSGKRGTIESFDMHFVDYN